MSQPIDKDETQGDPRNEAAPAPRVLTLKKVKNKDMPSEEANDLHRSAIARRFRNRRRIQTVKRKFTSVLMAVAVSNNLIIDDFSNLHDVPMDYFTSP